MLETEKRNVISQISALNEQTAHDANQAQYNAISRSRKIKNMDSITTSRYNTFMTTQQRAEELKELYVRQRRIMWMYVALVVVLVGGLSYLMYWAYDPSTDIARSSGRESSIQTLRENSSSAKDSFDTVLTSIRDSIGKVSSKVRSSISSASSDKI